MSKSGQQISLGFTQQHFSPGVHICQIFSDDQERQEALYQFLLAGFKGKEKTACFTEKLSPSQLDQALQEEGLLCQDLMEAKAFALAGTSDVYFEGGKFDPDRMLALLRQFYQDSQTEGFQAARVIGEMTPQVEHTPGGNRLLEYESRVSLLLKDYPVTAVCQYDAHQFSGSMIMDVLKVHPLMVVRGEVVHNPFYITPQEYLNQQK